VDKMQSVGQPSPRSGSVQMDIIKIQLMSNVQISDPT